MNEHAFWPPPPRTIMTPGPVEADPRVLRAMSYPILGQFDPAFTAMMNELMGMLRRLFRTSNRQAYPVDGTSRAGLEAVLAGVIEPGDRVLVPICGRFGHLLHEIAERYGAEVTVIEREWGTAFDPEEIIRAIRRHRPKVVALVHGETSTGRLQPLDGIGAACREYDALLVVDAVATIGGVPVNTDDWQLDAVVGGTQKCLSVPSGMAPLTYNARVERLLAGRRRIERGLRSAGEGTSARPYIRSNYLDLCQLQDYWGPERLNHHTEMTAMLYGLYEGVRIVLEEGLEARFRRHRMHERALTAGLAAMGLRLFGDPSCKLPVVTCVNIPEGIDGESVRSMLLDAFGIEIAGSFGPLKGRIWRIGTMGYSCNMRNVLLTLGALEAALLRHGMRVPAGQAVQAAMDVYAEEQAVQTG
ncbi:Purine catabolism protein PucG [Thermobacillus xylanilyticus]|jgi:(S)-ureidoglycine-glyoxylate aminotransferase|uniref:Purine catabolism protein PucG n=1 Tax=Thermobacillus xylanilyticus TaxID=76633 RepID=A0ABM8V3B3_THEXY|nr:alanine--glyoxylate aminotransferase family protein [Thermobacillus xylanilyticus]REJ14937.1 MAG: aminotransferase [Paenibacillaceae bacterium]CAG5084795.1 Purine catabolism protein PucG [Thermobacillus xylanilyticus]